MALPSGTSISADDINTYLGRSSGTAVDWNTTVRTLSNTTTATPDLNGVRGRYSRGLYASTGRTTDTYAATTNYNSTFINAFNIPGTPWRLIARGYPCSGAVVGNGLELAVVGSGMKVYNVYRQDGGTSFLGMGAGYYPAADWNCAMLANGKFIITCSLSQSRSQYFGDRGLGITILTFNNDGTIATCNNYYTSLSSIISIGNPYLLYNRRENREMSTFGNKCAFTVEWGAAAPGDRWVMVSIDGTNSNPVVQYAQVSYGDTSNTDTGGSVNAAGQDQGGLTPIIYYDGSMSIIRAPVWSNGGEAVANIKLNAAGTAYANPGTRYGVNSASGYTPVIYLPSSSYPATGYGVNVPLKQYGYHNVFKDNSLSHAYRNYFISRDYSMTATNIQVQGSPYPSRYWNGAATGVLIQKINATDNVIKYSLSIMARASFVYITSSGKNGTTTDYYSYVALNTRSICSIRTDSSDNTYYLFRVTYTGLGGSVDTGGSGSNGATPGYSDSGVTLYHLIKVNSSGSVLWQKTLDIGPLNAAVTPFVYPSSAGLLDGDMPFQRASFSILLREEIDEVEIYGLYGEESVGSNPWNFTQTSFVSRFASFRSSDGAPTSTIAVSNNSLGTLNISSISLSGTNYGIKSTNGSFYNVTLYPLSIVTRTNVPATSNSTNYNAVGTAYTETLSSISTSLSQYPANPTTFTTGLGIYERYTE